MRSGVRPLVVLGAGLVFLLAACDAGVSEPRGQSEPRTAPAEHSSPEDVGTTAEGSADRTGSSGQESTGDQAGTETEDPEPEPTPEPEPAADEGSRENPFLIGEDVGNDDWSVMLEEPYEAWDEVRAENQFNDPPADGMEFWMLPVTVTYTGTETGDPAWDLDFGFVGDDGRTYDDDCGTVPEELWDVGEMYPDAEANANVCLEVPEGAPGLWTVAASYTDPVLFTAEQE
ncbi:MAG TPA: hypothetical protein H9815_01665, partial [Candidatus Ruania gallistercoris]|nr:hypothetical protein [Candidatus Ruania gallistercoris]